jgi:L-iditol 2-dehydrogenase
MKSAILYSPGDLRIEDVEPPELGTRDVLINVEYSGICGLDRRIYSGDLKIKTPLTIGHEFVGIISETGEGVTLLNKGDRVTVNPTVPCAQCTNCKMGRDNQCENIKTVGIVFNGSYAQQIKVPEHSVLQTPKGVSPEVCTILGDAAPAAFRAIHTRGCVKPGDTVVIVGTGAVAQCCTAFAKAKGAQVIVVGRTDEKLDVAEKMGADLTINNQKEDAEKIIKQETNNRGADIAYDVVGEGEIIKNCLAYVRRGGTAVLVGYIAGDTPLSMRDTVFREKSILGSLGYRKKDYTRMIQLIEKSKIDLSPIITDIMPLENAVEAFNKLDQKNNSIKILLKP